MFKRVLCFCKRDILVSGPGIEACYSIVRMALFFWGGFFAFSPSATFLLVDHNYREEYSIHADIREVISPSGFYAPHSLFSRLFSERYVLFPCSSGKLGVYFVAMELDDVKTLTRKLLAATHRLANGPNTYSPPSLFAIVAEGTFRRDYLTLYTMLYLAEHEKPEARTAFATSCMDLCRRVHEDLISLEYMLFEDKEAYANKFIDYAAVERKRESDYLESVGAPLDPQSKQKIDEKYDEVKDQFLDQSGKAKRKGWAELTDFLKSEGIIDSQVEQKIAIELNKRYTNVDGQPRRAWAGLDVEGMIEELVKGGVIDAFQQGVLIQTYLKGNAKNHFSPSDIQTFLHNEFYTQTNDDDLFLSMVVTTIAITRMARILADEVADSEETIQRLEEIGQMFKTAHLPPQE